MSDDFRRGGIRYSVLENGTLAVATLVLGLMAGFFWTYTFNVNRALLEVDGAIYATVQSLLNRNVRHLSFFALFFGAGLLPIISALVNLRHRREPSFWLVVLAGLIYVLGVIALTRQVNLPLNAYTESWNPTALPADWQATRDRWNAANAIRVWSALGAFVLCLAALVARASHRH